MKVPDETLRISYQVFPMVTHDVNCLYPLEEPSEAGSLGHAGQNYIGEDIHKGACKM